MPTLLVVALIHRRGETVGKDESSLQFVGGDATTEYVLGARS